MINLPGPGVPNAGVDLTVTCPKCGHVGPSAGGGLTGGVMALAPASQGRQ